MTGYQGSYCTIIKVDYAERGEWDTLQLPIFKSDAMRSGCISHWELATRIVDALTAADREVDAFVVTKAEHGKLRAAIRNSQKVLKWKKRLRNELRRDLDQHADGPVVTPHFGLALGGF